MDIGNDPSRPTGREAIAQSSPSAPSLIELARGIRQAAGARVQLFELEAQRAALSIAKMVGFAVAAALLVVTAWLIVAGGMTLAAVRAGMPWWVGMLLVIALHLFAAWLLVGRIKSNLGDVSFAASRRTLFGANDGSR